ncbi:unnamed protein product [Symbiodinium natans]|uniref:Uncharacterized protein n=1 Tax=Symbiodinium natans TaxID=878477 RepID=A0A812NMX6_9DINO|nr:unnamed protein product [Symbiodinium natans]
MHQFEPHSPSSSVCAMGKLKWQQAPLWEATGSRVMQRLPELDSRGLSNTAWSSAALRQSGRLLSQADTDQKQDLEYFNVVRAHPCYR